MPLARSRSVALVGIDGHLVDVEVDLAGGLPSFALIGLPDAALHEARDRIRAAVVNSGQAWPNRRITVGLSPAALPKHGSAFDLPMAAALLAAAGAVPGRALDGCVMFGELGLDGRVRRVPGVLPAVLAATTAGVHRVVVPVDNAAEAALVPGTAVLPVSSLRSLVDVLNGRAEPSPPPAAAVPEPDREAGADLADVVGQLEGRRAVEIAAAGGHHLLLQGPPGAGKTMLAERLPGLLPDLDRPAALEVTAVHSVAGTLRAGCPLVTRPPFCSPHHTSSVAALVGGGSGLARPGAASLAHRGVLFLDEAPEFPRPALDALRQPLESGRVVLARSGGTATYPAAFTLVLAANPCPCAKPGSACSCPSAVRRRYLARLSGPLLDRVDLRVVVQPVSRAALSADRSLTETSAVVRARVREARDRAAHRLRGTPWSLGAQVPGSELRRRWPLDPPLLGLLHDDVARGLLSARGVDRVLRVAWTLADLAGRPRPSAAEVGEARMFRLGAAG